MMAAQRNGGRRPGFWTGVLVGLSASWLLSRVRLDPDRIARVGYNLIAPLYDPLLERWGSLRQVRRTLVGDLHLQPGNAVLEVCVGTGANLPYIAEHIGPRGKIAGLDISEGMLAEARKKLAALPCPVELRLGMAEHLPYPDATFDAVLSFGALNYITDRKRALDEMVRVAKPGAYLIVGDETLAPDGWLRGWLSSVVQTLVPRVRPPLEFVAGADVRVAYPAKGLLYLITWRKPTMAAAATGVPEAAR